MNRRMAFSLLELLAVVAVLGGLIGLLLPAVQRVREAAAGVDCRNNARQTGLAFHGHEATFGVFPSNGGGTAHKRSCSPTATVSREAMVRIAMTTVMLNRLTEEKPEFPFRYPKIKKTA